MDLRKLFEVWVDSDLKAQIIVGSIRHLGDVNEALDAGASGLSTSQAPHQVGRLARRQRTAPQPGLEAAALADREAARRGRHPAAVAAAEAQRAGRHHHPRHRSLLQSPAEGHQG
ncbi:MAG: hypothetical protein ABR562_07400, partial [Thermoplasmatota archaeon]